MQLPTSGEFENGVHRIAFRVYYEDTDAGGIVYHSNYFRFAERARTEALRLSGIRQSERFAGQSTGFVVGRASIEYRAPLKLDDVVIVESTLQEIRKVRMTMLQRLTCEGREMARITVEIVSIGGDGRASAIPPDIMESFVKMYHVTDQETK